MEKNMRENALAPVGAALQASGAALAPVGAALEASAGATQRFFDDVNMHTLAATKEAWEGVQALSAHVSARVGDAIVPAWAVPAMCAAVDHRKLSKATREAWLTSAGVTREAWERGVEIVDKTVQASAATVQVSAAVTVDVWEGASDEARRVWLALQGQTAHADADILQMLSRLRIVSLWDEASERSGRDDGAGGGSHTGDGGSAMAPAGDRCTLLGSRQFVTDLARLSEQLVMDDMGTDYWPQEDEGRSRGIEQLAGRFSCREAPAPFAPDKVGEIARLSEADAEGCEVRRRRALWADDLHKRYGARVLAWIDTNVALEKQAALVRLQHPEGEGESGAPVLVIVFRGSKKVEDFLMTDVSVRLTPLPNPTIASPSHPPPPSQQQPACTIGLWNAYAGSRGGGGGSSCDSTSGSGELWRDQSPRALVRRAVEAALTEEPSARVVITGHSLGGAMATLCAYDLLTSSPTIKAHGVTVASFAAPRFFNRAFQRAARSLEDDGSLRALRILISTDIIPRLPPRQLGMSSGIAARVVLDPWNDERPIRYRDDEADCDERMWSADVHAHTSHALYLGSETTPGRLCTLPPESEFPWPACSKAYMCKQSAAAGGS
jgi:hypothetical protein